MIPVMMLAACQPKETKAPALDPTDMDLTVAPGFLPVRERRLDGEEPPETRIRPLRLL